MDKEPERTEPTALDGIEYWEGRHSGKLLRICISVDTPHDKLSIIHLQTKVLKGLERKAGLQPAASGSALNTNVAGELLEQNFTTLLRDLAKSHGEAVAQ